MPCDTVKREERERLEREHQLKALEAQLREKSASIVRTGNKVSIEGWKERGGWCDSCAVRKLQLSTDATIRAMVANAMTGGIAIAFGHGHATTHSHGGHTHTH